MKIEEMFRVKQEDTEEQTGWFLFTKLSSAQSPISQTVECASP